MRTTESSTTFARQAYMRTVFGTTWYANSSVIIKRSQGSRSDITKSNYAEWEWRPPLPYYASFKGEDCINVDVEIVDSRGNYFYGNVGKLGSNSDESTIRVSQTELNAMRPTQNDINHAIVLARNNVADRVAGFAESFAEVRQTISMLGTMAGNINNFLEAAQRRNWRKAAGALGIDRGSKQYSNAVRSLQGAAGTVPNAWLAFNFGLAPVVSDMVSLCILLGGEWDLRATGKTVLPLVNEVLVEPTTGHLGYTPATLQYDVRTRRESGVHVRLDYTISSELLRGFAKFGVTDIVQLGWALVPYSFLVDFVLPVSTVLRSLTATIGLSFQGGSSTSFVNLDIKTSGCTLVPSPGYKVIRKTFLDAHVKGHEMNRVVYKMEPNPIPLWVKDPFHAFAAITSLSILAQRISQLFLKR